MHHIIGAPKESLDTVVLLLEVDVLENNMARMANTIVKEGRVGWSPHTKGM